MVRLCPAEVVCHVLLPYTYLVERLIRSRLAWSADEHAHNHNQHHHQRCPICERTPGSSGTTLIQRSGSGRYPSAD
jgi:formate dehydrogenase maturation protein FdhE